MSSRSASIVILCEDDHHEWFVRRYLYRLGYGPHDIDPSTAPQGRGSGAAFVLGEFPRQLAEIRVRSRRRRSFLVVVVDADTRTTADRRRDLASAVEESQSSREKGKAKPLTRADAVIFLIPKRNIETWVLALTGATVNESEDYSRDKRVDNKRIKEAAEALFDGLRRDPLPEWPDSLREAVEEFRRLEQMLK